MTAPGFKAKNSDSRLVCKLHKSLYGLKQAVRAWFKKLFSSLISLGFKASKCDSSLFIKNDSSGTLYVLAYVDDIDITCSSKDAISHLISTLHSHFPLKDLGPFNFFLGGTGAVH